MAACRCTWRSLLISTAHNLSLLAGGVVSYIWTGPLLLPLIKTCQETQNTTCYSTMGTFKPHHLFFPPPSIRNLIGNATSLGKRAEFEDSSLRIQSSEASLPTLPFISHSLSHVKNEDPKEIAWL
ncbi:uncharacterized protein LOC111482625 isoform X4 [Cucurbita maxima]|uniref:Uncharacterized protein LOC111482625 isoform X4 n=1 Tax=Cucurbita maxima TaxID=3661 RepID=A0A6J1J875_CUCMA|nr:uncharacterized protein LOC111482625 isoform X4 [Cucurbita maxima]